MTLFPRSVDKFQIYWWLVLLFVFTIPFPQVISIKLLMVALAFSLFVPGNFSRVFLFGWDTLLYLIVLLIGLTYTHNWDQGLKQIEYNLSFLALPIMLVKVPFDDKRLKELFHAFSGGLFTASFVCVAHAFYQFGQTGDWGVFLFHRLTDIIDSHPTYFTYYLITVVTCGLHILFSEQPQSHKGILAGFLVFFFVVILCAGGLTAFVSMLLVLAFFVLRFLLEEKTKGRILSLILVVLMIFGMFEFSSFNSKNATGERTNDYWERITLWESALKASPNILLGTGTGEDQDVLNAYYASHQLPEFAQLGYNAHNQFLQTFVSNGLIALVVLLILIGRPLFLSIRDQNVLGTLIFFPFLIYGMTEVFLGRYQGIVFFVLAHQVFMGFHYETSGRVAYRKAD